MIQQYILLGRLPVPCADLLTWGQWMQENDTRVDETHVGCLRVSTVFLGLDHCFNGGPPLLFETMVLGDIEDRYQTRCCTWDEAERMHVAAVVVAAAKIAAADRLIAADGIPVGILSPKIGIPHDPAG